MSHRFVSVERLADTLGVGVRRVNEGLVKLDLAHGETPYDEITPVPKPLARRLFEGEWYQPSVKWSDSILPQLGVVLRVTPAQTEEEIAAHRTARHRADIEARRERTRRLAVQAEQLEAQLSQLNGFARVQAMIEQRTPVLQAQYTEDEWREQLCWQLDIATSMQREHSFDESYPSFESELWDRVIFTLDEQLVAARRFEAEGRATPVTVAFTEEMHV